MTSADSSDLPNGDWLLAHAADHVQHITDPRATM